MAASFRLRMLNITVYSTEVPCHWLAVNGDGTVLLSIAVPKKDAPTPAFLSLSQWQRENFSGRPRARKARATGG